MKKGNRGPYGVRSPKEDEVTGEDYLKRLRRKRRTKRRPESRDPGEEK